jgi:2-alkyl-3-oxoalkanoate reductase
MRLVHVENCAEAIISALSAQLAGEAVYNLVDDEQPSHWRYHRMARKAGARIGRALPVPYWLVRLLGVSARLASRVFFAGRARLPEMLDPPRQRVRWRSLRYANVKARGDLAWQETVSLHSGIAGLVNEQNRFEGNTR